MAARCPSPRSGNSALDLDGAALNRQVALLNIVRRINAQPSFAVLLEDVAKLAAQGVGARFGAWGTVVSGEQCHLTLARVDAQGRPPAMATGAFPLSAPTLEAWALQMGQVIAAENFGTQEPRIDRLLQREGVVGGITVPFHVNAKPAGLLGVYSDVPRKWRHDDVVFVETVAHLLVAFSARLVAEEQLEAERQARIDLQETVNAIVIALDPDGRIVDLNESAQRLTGYTLEEVRGAPFCSKLVPPEETELVEGILRSCRNESFTNEYAGLLMRKDGSQLRVVWTLKLLHNGQMQSIVLVGVDRAEQFQAVEKLRQMNAVTHNAVGALCVGRKRAQWPLASDKDDPIASPAGNPQTGTGNSTVGHGDNTPPDPQSARTHAGLPVPFRERRASPRHPYPYRQSIAPIVDRRMPDAVDFSPVECRDISSVGVAFFYDRVPDFTELALELGTRPQVTRLVCRVVRVAGVEHQGRKRYLVGCRFIGRCKR